MNKETLTLAATTRAKGENPKLVRKAGNVPGVIYGGKAENMTVECTQKDLHNIYVKAGENTLVEVLLDNKKIPCLIHAISFDPVTDREEHVDFYAVDMSKKVTTHIPVIVIGESPAVKGLGGVLVTVHDEVEVTCLPSDIPASFIVDIGVLQNFRESITVASLVLPPNVTMKSAPEMVILTVQEPRKEEVAAVVIPTADAAAAGTPAAGAAPAGDAAKAGDAGKDKAAKK